ncbi:MAG: signal peptidase I [Solirubrobacteraceae bacterium]
MELAAIVAIALGLAFGIQAFIVKPYEIPSGSMIPALDINQRILVDRIGMAFTSPSVGDIYVFHPPVNETCADPGEGENGDGPAAPAACDVARRQESSQTYVKRVVGLPGDRLSIVNGRVIRNGVAERGWATEPCGGAAECNFPQTITVPRGDYYMMGDNRGDSLDSRFWGPVPKAWLIGQAFFTYWPPDRIGSL